MSKEYDHPKFLHDHDEFDNITKSFKIVLYHLVSRGSYFTIFKKINSNQLTLPSIINSYLKSTRNSPLATPR